MELLAALLGPMVSKVVKAVPLPSLGKSKRAERRVSLELELRDVCPHTDIAWRVDESYASGGIWTCDDCGKRSRSLFPQSDPGGSRHQKANELRAKIAGLSCD